MCTHICFFKTNNKALVHVCKKYYWYIVKNTNDKGRSWLKGTQVGQIKAQQHYTQIRGYLATLTSSPE